jgi:hypothetical protein
MTEITYESFKELFRLVALATVSFLLTGGLELVLRTFGTGMTSDQFLIATGLLTSVLKACDKWLHLKGQETEEETGVASKLTTGITRF